MFEHLFYREKGIFLQSLHSSAAISYVAVLFLFSLMFSHPLYLIGVFIAAFSAVVAADGLEAWQEYLKVTLFMILLIMVINPLMVHSGKTVLWYGPSIPVIGRLIITLEAVCYGAAMSIRLLAIITIFCLLNLIVHPDKLLQALSRFAYKSTLTVSLATRMFPAMMRDLNNIKDVQQMRGVVFESGRFKERVKKYSNMFNILVLSSLEGSLQIAEAMQARAFGSGPRSRYRREMLRPRDWLCIIGILWACLVGIVGIFKGYGAFAFYPEMDYLIDSRGNMINFIAIMLGLMVPVALSWGWHRWHYLKYRI